MNNNNNHTEPQPRPALLMIQETGEDQQLMEVAVLVKGQREIFGRTDYLVAPIGGKGEKWVSSHRVTIVDPQPKEEA